MSDIAADMEFIAKSIRKLPPWNWEGGGWWPRFGELSDNSREYLGEKLAGITWAWDLTDRTEAADACRYVLVFFDNPALYEHLDSVEDTWSSAVPGRTGQRWAEAICAAAWRVIVATEPDNAYPHQFSVPEEWWKD